MDVLHQVLALFVLSTIVRENDDSRLDALVDVALTIGWRQHDHTGIAFFRESIDAVVVVLVEHPEVILFCQLRLLDPFRATEHRQLDRRVIQNHMKLEFHDGLDEADKVRTAHVVFEHLPGIVVRKESLTAWLVLLLDEVFDLILRVLEDLSVVIFKDTL